MLPCCLSLSNIYLVMSGLEVSRILPQRFCCKDNIYLNTFQQNHVKFKKSYENMVLF